MKRRPHEQVFTMTSFICSCGREKMARFSLTSLPVEKLADSCQGKTWHISPSIRANKTSVKVKTCSCGGRLTTALRSYSNPDKARPGLAKCWGHVALSLNPFTPSQVQKVHSANLLATIPFPHDDPTVSGRAYHEHTDRKLCCFLVCCSFILH